MVLAADVRRKNLSALMEKPSDDGRSKLFYKGQNRVFDVYRIDLDWLIYNRHNGRLEAEMLTWQREHSVGADVYDDEMHKLIEGFLWQSNVGRNEHTLEDLRQKQQQRPGIVSLDGVIIDGNRRAMLLRRLERETKEKQYFDAIVLPDAYNENQAEIVRLETQYQLGEDAKVEYGPLQKYLHAKRLRYGLNIEPSEIDRLMNESKGNAERLLAIMALMDDYLEHIGCPGLYTLLRDADGTREGMFVDLYGDLKRIESGKKAVPWVFDKDLDPAALQLIQFDYIRLNAFADQKKTYREISHQGSDRNFFAQKEIWEAFRDQHEAEIHPITEELGTLEEFIANSPTEFKSKTEAARTREEVWKSKAMPSMKANFGKSSSRLNIKVTELRPKEYLERARDYLLKIDQEAPAFLSDALNGPLVVEINQLTYEMKKKFERAAKKRN